MGRATRWFKSLFGIKNAKENVGNEHSGDRRPNARHDTVGLCNNPATIPPNITPAEAAWLRSFFNDTTEKEHSKHAIAVAAATAAAADAAVAAAQAAVAVVRLTSQQGRGGGSHSHTNAINTPSFGGAREKYLSALKIQTVFRGFLARKALRALKGLVKIQALVRGFLVRKQAAATLYSMQALIRAQASVRARRNRSFITADNDDIINCSTEMKNEDLRSHEETQQHIPSHSHSSRRLSSSIEPGPFDQEIPKIVEIDTGSKAQTSKSRRTSSWTTNPDSIDIISESLAATIPHRINTTSHNPSRLLNPDNSYCWDEHCHISTTTQSTPRFATYNCGCEEHGFITTPSKSACLDDDKAVFHPNYMAKTVSFKAKLRSQSAPRQRPEGGFSKRRLSLHEMMESRNSLRMERSSCSQSQVREVVTFKNAVMGKINGRRF